MIQVAKPPTNPAKNQRSGRPQTNLQFSKLISAIKSTTKAVEFVETAKTESVMLGESNTKTFSQTKKERFFRQSIISKNLLQEAVDFNNPEHEKLFISILTVRPEKRYEEEVSYLQKAFKDIEIFDGLEQQMDEKTFRKIFRVLRLVTAKAGEKIINYGEYGKDFYVIIKGGVFVLLKSDKIVENKKGRRKTFRKSFHENYNDQPNQQEEKITVFNTANAVEQANPGFWVAKELTKGQGFGEMALNKGSNRKRTATIICKEDCIFGSLTYHDYCALLGDIYQKKTIENVDLLSGIDMFKLWKDYEITPIAASFDELKYTRNHVVFKEGDQSSRLYFIKKGEIELQKSNVKDKGLEDSFDGPLNMKKNSSTPMLKYRRKLDSIRLGILMRGNYFGEGELINLNPREYTAVVYSAEAIVLSMERDKFVKFFKEKRRFHELEAYIQKKKIWRQDFLSKVVDVKGSFTDTKLYPESFISNFNTQICNEKLEQGLPSEKVNDFINTFSAFKNYRSVTFEDIPDIRTPLSFQKNSREFDMNSPVSRMTIFSKSISQHSSKDKVPNSTSHKVFNSVLKRFHNLNNLNESKQKKLKLESPLKKRMTSVIDKPLFVKTETSESSYFLPKDYTSTIQQSDSCDPYSMIEANKSRQLKNIKNISNMKNIENAKNKTDRKDRRPMIKLIKSLGLDRVYQETLPLSARMRNTSYITFSQPGSSPKSGSNWKPFFPDESKKSPRGPGGISDSSIRASRSFITRSLSPKVESRQLEKK